MSATMRLALLPGERPGVEVDADRLPRREQLEAVADPAAEVEHPPAAGAAAHSGVGGHVALPGRVEAALGGETRSPVTRLTAGTCRERPDARAVQHEPARAAPAASSSRRRRGLRKLDRRGVVEVASCGPGTSSMRKPKCTACNSSSESKEKSSALRRNGTVEQQSPRVGPVAGVHLGEIGAQDAVLDRRQEPVGHVLPARHAAGARPSRARRGASPARGRPRRRGSARPSPGSGAGSYWPSGWSITTTSASALERLEVAGLLVAAVADVVRVPDHVESAAGARAPPCRRWTCRPRG